MTRRLLVSLLTISLLSLVLAGVASADKPFVRESTNGACWPLVPAPATRSCATYRVEHHHDHRGNDVVHIEVTGETSAGHVMTGNAQWVEPYRDFEHLVFSFREIWTHPDNGAKIKTDQLVRFIGNAPVLDLDDPIGFNCIRPPDDAP